MLIGALPKSWRQPNLVGKSCLVSSLDMWMVLPTSSHVHIYLFNYYCHTFAWLLSRTSLEEANIALSKPRKSLQCDLCRAIILLFMAFRDFLWSSFRLLWVLEAVKGETNRKWKSLSYSLSYNSVHSTRLCAQKEAV